MIGTLATLISFSLIGGSASDPTIKPADFQGWFALAVKGRLPIPEPVKQRASGFRYVFVGGFGNERMPTYFTQNASALRALGVPRQAIHFVYPSSRTTVEENRAQVEDELLRIAEMGTERVVVIGHSRGACDTLAFALHNPYFVRDRIEALFLIQGPFGGSGLADYVEGEGKPLDHQMPRGHRLIASLLSVREKSLMEQGEHGGLAGLTHKASRAFWRRIVEEQADAVPIVEPKVFYVESQSHPSRLRLFQRALGWYLKTYYGPNDGVVAVGDQTVPNLGMSLGILDAGHADLTRKFPATRASRHSRRALMQCIVMAVGRSEACDTDLQTDNP